MNGIEKGIAAGEKAAPRRKNVWKPLGYERAGYLIALIENTGTGSIERIIENAGEYIHWELGRGVGGEIRAYTAKGGLKKIAKAMLNRNADWYSAAHSEAPAWSKDSTDDESAAPKRTRRKR
jgi:hypothetical protein